MKKIALVMFCTGLGDCISGEPSLRKLAESYEVEGLTVFSYRPDVFENHPLVQKSLHISDGPAMNGADDIFVSFDLRKKTFLKHNAMDIRQFHATFLGFNLLREEMACRFYAKPFQDIPKLPKEYILLHPSKTWPSRSWPLEAWQGLVKRLKEELTLPLVSIGKDDSHESGQEKTIFSLDVDLNLNQQLDLSQAWHVCKQASLVVTMDSGILHLAGTTDTHIILLGSSIHPQLRIPYRDGSQEYKMDYLPGPCPLFCGSNLKYSVREHGTLRGVPYIKECLEKKETFECHPDIESVFQRIKERVHPKWLRT